MYRKDSTTRIFFFFQAEDGIRGATVTGVQTCALPIYEPRPAVEDHLGDGTTASGDDGRAAGESFDHGEAEWLGPIDGEQEGLRLAQEFCLRILADLPDEVDERMVEERLDVAIE